VNIEKHKTCYRAGPPAQRGPRWFGTSPRPPSTCSSVRVKPLQRPRHPARRLVAAGPPPGVRPHCPSVFDPTHRFLCPLSTCVVLAPSKISLLPPRYITRSIPLNSPRLAPSRRVAPPPRVAAIEHRASSIGTAAPQPPPHLPTKLRAKELSWRAAPSKLPPS
jgi:hypothetical protein